MTWHTKFRPKTFDEVVGQESIVKSLRSALKANRSHTFLFHGPSGCGKTTLAYIAAKELGAGQHDIMDIDGATYTGIDDMRGVTRGLEYRPLSGKIKAVVLDEVHAISPQAFKSLLKALETPPDWVYWFLCTTEFNKVPKNIKTRCLSYGLKAVSQTTLKDLLVSIAEREKIKVLGKVLDLCVREADGSPRQAIVNLEACADCTNVEVAADLLASAGEVPAAFELARALNARGSWKDVQKLLNGLKETNPESVRRVVLAYMTSVALGNPKEAIAGKALEVLDAFSQPFPSGEGLAPLVLACGKLLLA